MTSYVTKRVDLRRDVYAVVKYFQMENIPRSTIYRIIQRFEHGLPCEDKTRKGYLCKLEKKQQQKLKDSTENRAGINQRKLAMKFNISQSCIPRNLNKLGLKYCKRQRALKYNEQQLPQISSKCR